jgi:hypothetical protein
MFASLARGSRNSRNHLDVTFGTADLAAAALTREPIPDDGLLTYAELKFELTTYQTKVATWVSTIKFEKHTEPILKDTDKLLVSLAIGISKVDELDQQSDDLRCLARNLQDANHRRNKLHHLYTTFVNKNGEMLDRMMTLFSENTNHEIVHDSPDRPPKKSRTADELEDASQSTEGALVADAELDWQLSREQELKKFDDEEDPVWSKYTQNR